MLNNILFDTDDMYLFEGYITDDEEDEEDVNMSWFTCSGIGGGGGVIGIKCCERGVVSRS